jgi:uncharacterized RDD family membrane protein YckC/NAD-dependent dihydropyrimidine dehydrogenase PreA subunit
MGDYHWRELYREVVDTGLCTGCAACVMACPQDVLGYTDDYYPVQIGAGMGVDQCVTGDRGCDICTRACPRFRTWETELDTELFGRPRTAEEVAGIARSMLLVRATDEAIHAVGQDGGLVSVLLIWGLENEMILEVAYVASGLITLVYVVAFWAVAGATPGKLMLGMRIVGPDGSVNGIGTGCCCGTRYTGHLRGAYVTNWASATRSCRQTVSMPLVQRCASAW